MDEDRQVLRAEKARRLLEDETLKDAFAAIKQRYLNHIIGSELSQVDRREQAFKLMKAIDELHAQLNSWVNEGKVIEDRRKLRKQYAPATV